jgi:TonB family protein
MNKIASALIFLAFSSTLVAQQPLPSAPEPKPAPAPTPFKVPEKTQPVPPPPAEPQKKPQDDVRGLSGITTEPLEHRDQLILKDYLSSRLVPAVRSHWFATIPEEAQSKRRPLYNKKGKSGKVTIAFTLHRDGSVSDVSVDDSSGDKVLDLAAFHAVKDCQPGSLPAVFSKDTLKMHFTFYYNPKF